MSWTPYQIFLAIMMVITGSINTLSTKWADNTSSEGTDGEKKPFNHPFVQAVGMFIGEMTCLVAFYFLFCYRKRHGTEESRLKLGNNTYNRAVFLPAALCDMLATSIMYIGLNLTFASSFQMLRGAVIVFTALLSVAFLGRTIRCHMWVGIGFICCGLVLVGISDILFADAAKNNHGMNAVVAGDLLIIVAQVVTAAQMVYEEKFVTRLNVHPLQAVGWEGVFGFVVLGLLLIPMYYIPSNQIFSSSNRLEDAIDAFHQIANNKWVLLATIGNIVSIAFFNFSGISVTKEISATTRMVLDSTRTVVIWGFSLAVSWQNFTWQSFLMQLGGFVLLALGMFVYNDSIFTPFLRSRGWIDAHNTASEFVPQRDEDGRRDVNLDDDERANLLNAEEPVASTSRGQGRVC